MFLEIKGYRFFKGFCWQENTGSCILSCAVRFNSNDDDHNKEVDKKFMSNPEKGHSEHTNSTLWVKFKCVAQLSAVVSLMQNLSYFSLAF